MENVIVLASFFLGVFSHGARWKYVRRDDPAKSKSMLIVTGIWLAIFLAAYGIFSVFHVAERPGLWILTVLTVISFGQLLVFGI